MTRALAAVPLLLIPAALSAQTIERCEAAGSHMFDRAGDVEFVVTLLGNVVLRPTGPVTEEDQIRVRVLASETLAHRLAVRRTSPARRTGELRLIGAPQAAAPGENLLDKVRNAAVNPGCFVDVTLADFEPGLGEVEIELVTQSGDEIKRAAIGAFDFNVEPMYAGMISLGPIITRLADPSFEVATNAAGERYIAEVESGDDRIVYGLVYTPFLWGKRMSEPPLRWNLRSMVSRVNPMFGIVVNDIRRNALAGGSVDLPFGLVAHLGWHIGRTSQIDPASGLEVGSLFPFEDGATIPVVSTWETDGFVGLTLDMRVALKLLGLAGSAAVQ